MKLQARANLTIDGQQQKFCWRYVGLKDGKFTLGMYPSMAADLHAAQVEMAKIELAKVNHDVREIKA